MLLQGWVLERVPALADSGARIVVDLYDPFGLELLMLIESEPAARREAAQANALRALHDQLRAGDFFLCASERQRDYWLGWLEALGRVNPRTHGADPDLRGLIDVVPFGVPSEPPRAHPRARAPRDLRDRSGRAHAPVGRRGVRLVRPGDGRARGRAAWRERTSCSWRPGTRTPSCRRRGRWARRARRRDRASTSTTAGSSTSRRADWLLDADAGVSAHHEHVETRFAFRTRILDYLWAGLPGCARAGTRWPTRCSARTWAPRWRRGTSTGGWRRWRTSRTRSAARRAAPARPSSRGR